MNERGESEQKRKALVLYVTENYIRKLHQLFLHHYGEFVDRVNSYLPLIATLFCVATTIVGLPIYSTV